LPFEVLVSLDEIFKTGSRGGEDASFTYKLFLEIEEK